jgi:hypothetical protein
MTVLHSEDHEQLLRKVAHEAGKRFICCTNRVGATMVPGLFNPAEIAGRRLSDVRVYPHQVALPASASEGGGYKTNIRPSSNFARG